MVKLKYEWTYKDYLAVTEREDTQQNYNRWWEVVEVANAKWSDRIDEEIGAMIRILDEEVT